jgi:CBS domain-containing protein
MRTHAITTPVLEVMTRAPITVTARTTVGALMTLFDRHDFNAFPVVDEEGGVCGIVTKLDVLRLLRPDWDFEVPDSDSIVTASVADIMRRGVISVEPADPIIVAADLMVETRLRSLPVVQRRGGGPELVGIVTQGDLLRGLRFELADASRAAPQEPQTAR